MSSVLQPQRVIADLRELQWLTGDANGAQRLCWTQTWRDARAWLRAKLAELPVAVEVDEAGNLWSTLRGRSSRALTIGSHMDSITNGGWLDGCLGVLAGLEVLRRVASEDAPDISIRLVDWADEEGARFSGGCFGSGMATGSLDIAHQRSLTDRDGLHLEDVLRENGVELQRAPQARRELSDIAAYLELHIEQGPLLESLQLPMGVVQGTYGLEKYAISFKGQAAHAGAAPMHLRHDAFLAAARLAIAARDIARKHASVATVGSVRAVPGLPTVVPGEVAITLDLRSFDDATLATMLAQAQHACEGICRDEGVTAEWQRLWHIARVQFDPHLVAIASDVVRETCGASHAMPSGALHDAAEVSRFGIPTVMLFVQSLRGLSHAKEEDTREEHLELAVRALDLLARRVMDELARAG